MSMAGIKLLLIQTQSPQRAFSPPMGSPPTDIHSRVGIRNLMKCSEQAPRCFLLSARCATKTNLEMIASQITALLAEVVLALVPVYPQANGEPLPAITNPTRCAWRTISWPEAGIEPPRPRDLEMQDVSSLLRRAQT